MCGETDFTAACLETQLLAAFSTNSRLRVTPSPGPFGTATIPTESIVILSFTTSSRSGCSEQSNSKNGSTGTSAGGVGGKAAIKCNAAAVAIRVPQTWGMQRMPKVLARTATRFASVSPPTPQQSG